MAAAKSPAVRAPQTDDFNYRSKAGQFEWQGMCLDAEPATIPDNQFQRLINCRFNRGSIVPRGGQTAINPSDPFHDATACISGMYDFQIGTSKSMYIVEAGCQGVSGGVGFSINIYDQEQDPLGAPIVFYSTVVNPVIIGGFGGDLMIGTDNILRRFIRITPPWGTVPLTQSGNIQDVPLLTFTGYDHITCIQEFDGFSFIGLDDGLGGGKVVAWSGATIYDDLLSTNKPPTQMGVFNGSKTNGQVMFVGYNGTPNRIEMRAVGDPAGTYTNIAPGAGTIKFVRGAEYQDFFYIIDGDKNVWRTDGTSVAITHSFGAGDVTSGIAVLNNILYVFRTTSGGHAVIAKYDGSVWTDSWKDLTTQDVHATISQDLCSYRGSLEAGIQNNNGGTCLYSSNQDDTGGTYTKTTLQPSGTNAVFQIIVV